MANDLTISAKPTSPQFSADQNDWCSLRPVVIAIKVPSDLRPDAEHLKETGTDHHAPNHPDRAAGCEICLGSASPDGHRLKGPIRPLGIAKPGIVRGTRWPVCR